MKHRKISKTLAQDLASAITIKAFEHLVPAAEASVEAVGHAAYEKLDAAVDLHKLSAYGLVEKSDCPTLDICSSDPQQKCVTISIARKGYAFKGWGHYCIRDDALFTQATAAVARTRQLYKARSSLHRELYSQLLDKTTKQAVEAWPEAAEVIAEVADLDDDGNFTKPLEVLLVKFLPALPAPTGQGV